MRWTERQRAMLQGMGLRLWLPQGMPSSPPADVAAQVDAVDPAAALGLAGSDATGYPAPFAAARQDSSHRVALPAAAPTSTSAGTSAGTSPGGSDGAPVGVAGGVTGGAPGGAVAGMDWPALQAAVQGCQACGLCRTRRHTVFGVGHRQAHCMVVGEAPGEQEDRSGEPFVGAAGQLLDRMLATIGLARGGDDPARSVFIANTLKCRPPGNRNPTPEELAHCVPYLQRQVALVQPRLILAMGRFAVQALLQSDEPLGRLRGRLHRWQGVPVVVSYHPAYLLRQPADKAKAWADLCLAADCLQQPAPAGAAVSG